MGNSPSSSTDAHQLQRNTSSASNSGAKFTMVYQDTPAIVYRPDSFHEAIDQARHTFQIPRYQPLQFSYKYLSVGFVALTEHNWSAIMPTIHTLFITTKPLPPPSSTSTPPISESRRLSPAPWTSSEASHDWSDHSQSTEMSGVIPPSPLDPRVPALPLHDTATEVTAAAAMEPVTLRPNSLAISVPTPSERLPQVLRTPLTPIRSPLGKKPLPTPPAGRPLSLPHLPKPSPISIIPPAPKPPNQPPAFSPPSISPITDPSKLSIIIYHDDQSSRNALPEYRILHLPKTYTIADLKDVLSDEFVMPAYLQELAIGGKVLGEDVEEQGLEAAGLTQGVVVVLSRAAVVEKTQEL